LDHKIFFRVYVFVAMFFGFRLGVPENFSIFCQKDTKNFLMNYFHRLFFLKEDNIPYLTKVSGRRNGQGYELFS